MGRRGTPCTVCTHKARHQIEIGLVHGMSNQVLGDRFGLSKHAVWRHARAHLTPQMRAAILAAQKPSEIDLEALRTSESEGILAQLVTQRARLQQAADLAITIGDIRGLVAAENAITGNLTLVAKLLGQLVQHHQVTHANLLMSPDYLRMRQVLTAALKPFPDAARAVGAALHSMEAEAARDITAKGKKTPLVIEHAPVPPPPC